MNDGVAKPGKRARGRKRRLPRWVPPLPDLTLALVLLLASGGVVVVSTGSPVGEPPAPAKGTWLVVAVVALTVLQTVPLAFRRRRPVLVLAIVVAASVFMSFFERTPVEAFVLFIALYSVAAHTDRRTATRAGLAALVVLAAPFMLVGNLGALEAIFELGFLGLGWMAGAYLGELRSRADRVRREQENEKRRAVAEEQARIARELHDVMAHSMSVMVVQAAAAEDVFDRSPEQVREALRSIESTGRQALSEIRRVLDVVRPDDVDGRELGPQPGLSRLEELISQVRTTGLRILVRVQGARFELPGGVDLSAYRIVQEALTNSLKHGRGVSEATVVLHYLPGEFLVEVCDDGQEGSADAGSPATGRGLIGMRERVSLYGGDLVAGPRSGGGFGVRARFPIELELK
jgi:signal transduction histidine kinase